MGYSPWGGKESDTTKGLPHTHTHTHTHTSKNVFSSMSFYTLDLSPNFKMKLILLFS